MKIEAHQDAPNQKVDVTRRKAFFLLGVGAVATVLAACKSTGVVREQKRNEGGY